MQSNNLDLPSQRIGFRTDRLGYLIARKGRDDPKARCAWFGRLSLPGQQAATELVLQGTGKAPFRWQLAGVHRVVEALEDIRYALRRSLTRYPGKFRDLDPDTWYGELILVSATDEDTDTFELTFEWGQPPALRALAFQWAGGVPHDLRLH